MSSHSHRSYNRRSFVSWEAGEEFPFQSRSERLMKEVLVKEGLYVQGKTREQPLFFPRKKPGQGLWEYRTDVLFPHPIKCVGINYPIRWIEVKGALKGNFLEKIEWCDQVSSLRGVIVELPLIKYWLNNSMLELPSLSAPQIIGGQKIFTGHQYHAQLADEVHRVLDTIQVKFKRNVPVEFGLHHTLLDFTFEDSLRLPGVFEPIDAMYVLDHEADVTPETLYFQEYWRQKHAKRLVLVSRTHVDYWIDVYLSKQT